MAKRSKKDSPVRKDIRRSLHRELALLGLSFGALGLSVYAISGDTISTFVSNQQPQPPYVANAESNDDSDSVKSSDLDSIIDEGEYDVVIKVDDDGKRSYVLTPKDSSSDDKSDEDRDKDVKESNDSKDDDKKDNSESSNETKDKDDDEDDKGSDDDSDLSPEAQKKLEEHKSNRLRIRPDRDGADVYYYVVEKGDSLASISETFDVPLGQLMEENFIEDADYIYVGEVIFMPTDFIK